MGVTFREAFVAAVERSGKSLREIALGAGVSYHQLRRMVEREGSSTNVDDALQIAHYFGVTLDEFLQDRELTDRLRVVDLYNRLSPQERDLLRATARGLDAADNSED